MTVAEADIVLRDKNLTLGQASPQPVDPNAKIGSQAPAADEVVKAGAPVSIFYREAAQKRGEGGTGGG